MRADPASTFYASVTRMSPARPAKSVGLCVTSGRPCSVAVAAIQASAVDIDLPAERANSLIRAHSRHRASGTGLNLWE